MKKQGGGESLPTVQSFRSHSPSTLPSSVSCKSFPCHSYANSASGTVLRDENAGVFTQNFRFGSHCSQLATRHSPLDQRGGALLADRLLMPGSVSHGFIHIAVGLVAGIALTLIAALQVLKITLENLRARLAQAFSGSLVQCGFGPLLGRVIRTLPEQHNGVVSAPIIPILPLARSRDLLLQRVNQTIVGPQAENEPRDYNNSELLEHVAQPTASPMFKLADYSPRQSA